MEVNKTLIDLIEEKKFSEAAETFNKTPILDYETKNPIIKLNMFEYSLTLNKNPVFLRVLLNYISLINILFDQESKVEEFHQILFQFNAKFTFEEKNGFIKLILMAKSTIDVYNLIFQEKEKAFENVEPNIKQTIDFDFDKKEEESIGYTYQELARVFLNDYIIGRSKGNELPNLLFYIRSIDEIQNLIGKFFKIPSKLKIDLNEIITQSGVNEFDSIVLLKEDIIINENNPYFRYIKTVQGSNAVYEKLELKKDIIYIIEIKHSYTMNKKIVEIQDLAKTYMKLYNKNVYDIKEELNFQDFKILYFYNYFENLGYKNLSNWQLEQNKWKFLYLSPSCQIMSVTKLSSEVSTLKKKVAVLEKNVEENKEKIDRIDQFLEGMLSKNKFGKGIEQKRNEEFIIAKDLKYKIEEDFQELSKQIVEIKELKKYDKLFDDYKEEIKSFVNPEEKLEINISDNTWEKEFKEEIPDDKTCFQLIAPSIGHKKASKNYFKIQKYLYKKIAKKDEMSEIYQYLYYCFYGRRKLEDKRSPEKYFYEKGQVKTNLKDILVNIVKYTFYYDKIRNGKEYYLLALFQELLTTTNENIRDFIFKIRNKSLYEIVLMTIDIINDENGYVQNGYFSAPNKRYI